jgi:hypothetical protein
LAKASKKSVVAMVTARAEHGQDSIVWKLLAVGCANSGYVSSSDMPCGKLRINDNLLCISGE